MGVDTLAALARTPEEALVGRFGPNLGRELRRRGRFEHGGPVGQARRVASESRERTFDEDVSDPQRLGAALTTMAAELCASLAAHDRRGRTVGIKVRLDNFRTVTRARTLAEATREPGVVGGVALELLRRYAPERPVRLLGVRVAGFAPGADEQRSPAPSGHGGADRQRGAGSHGGPGDQLELPVQ
jgi:DNA polymerase-4